MKEKQEINYLYIDYPKARPLVTKNKEPNRQIRGSVRLYNNMFRTEKEQEKYIAASLKRKLP